MVDRFEAVEGGEAKRIKGALPIVKWISLTHVVAFPPFILASNTPRIAQVVSLFSGASSFLPPPFLSFLLLPDNTFVRYKCSFISERGEKMWVENTFVRTMDGEFFLSLFPSLLFFESIRLLFKSNVQRRTVVRVGNNIAPSL